MVSVKLQLRGLRGLDLLREIMDELGEWEPHDEAHRHFQLGGMIATLSLTPPEVEAVIDEIGVAEFPMVVMQAGAAIDSTRMVPTGTKAIFVMPVSSLVRAKVPEASLMSYEQAKEYVWRLLRPSW